MNEKPVARIAWAVCALVILAAAANAILSLPLNDTPLKLLPLVLTAVTFIVFGVTGALIVSHQPRNTVGWLWLWYIFPILFIPLFFPTGRLLSARWRWVVALGLGLCLWFVLQTLVGQAVDEQSPFIVVLSTLLIAALAAPLRRRVQAFIDRRFYRQSYDAQQVLARFASAARDEVETDRLAVELIRALQETMQPEKVLIWLKSGRKGRV